MKDAGLLCLEVEKLPLRFPEQHYSSYHVTLEKGEHDYDYYLSPTIWPEGAFIKRWYLPRRPVNKPLIETTAEVIQTTTEKSSYASARCISGESDNENDKQLYAQVCHVELSRP